MTTPKVPTPIVDKNGKLTTVHKNAAAATKTRKLPSPLASISDKMRRDNAGHAVPEDMQSLRSAASEAIKKSQYADLTIGMNALGIINAVEHNMTKKGRSFAHAYIITREERTKNASHGNLETFLAIEKQLSPEFEDLDLAPYIPHDLSEMDRMIASLPHEEDTTRPNSHIRLMGILRDDIEKNMGNGLDFQSAYETTRSSYYNAWIADYKGAITSFESLAD